MMQYSQTRAFVLFASLTVLLAACGGGGGSSGGREGFDDSSGSVGVDMTTYTELANSSAVEATSLTYVATDSSGDRTSGSAGSLDHVTGEITGGKFAGTMNAGRTEIDLNGGGTAELTNPSSTRYVLVFATEGAGTPEFGVIGQATDPNGIPASGTTQYVGSIDMTAADGNEIVSLTGDATITATWSAGPVVSEFDNFRGDSGGVDGSITLTTNSIVDNRFSGGQLSTTGEFFEITGSVDTSQSRGTFYGPSAEEVGGVLVVDGLLSVVGYYTAD